MNAADGRTPSARGLLGDLAQLSPTFAVSWDREHECAQVLYEVELAERRRRWLLRAAGVLGVVLGSGALGGAVAQSLGEASGSALERLGDAQDPAGSVSGEQSEQGMNPLLGAPRVDPGVWLSTDGAVLERRLSAGVRVTLEPWSRLRALSTSAELVWLSHEAGSASLDLTAGFARSFRWDAGPYVLLGSAATFDVHWEPHTHTFVVKVRRGELSLRGPGTDRARILQAGESAAWSGLPSEESVGGR